MRMDARRATQVVVHPTMPRSTAKQTPHWAAARRDEAFRAVYFVANLAKGVDHSLRLASRIPSRKASRRNREYLCRGSLDQTRPSRKLAVAAISALMSSMVRRARCVNGRWFDVAITISQMMLGRTMRATPKREFPRRPARAWRDRNSTARQTPIPGSTAGTIFG